MNTQPASVNNPVAMPIERGAGWLFEGFGYFSKSPLAWIGAMVLLFVITMVMAFIPFIGGLALNLLMPVFMAGLILGCQAQTQGEEFTINYLFAGFSRNTVQLIVLGLLYMLGIIALTILVVIIVLVMFGGMAMLENLASENPEIIMQNLRVILLITLIAFALYVPLLMAYWFAPALVVLADVSPVDALKMSFKGCLVNILPFTVYGIAGLILSIIAIIPFGLGLLILGPMITASIYISCSEIFGAR